MLYRAPPENEQVGEEASTTAVVGNLKPVDDSKGGLLLIDKELANRVPVYPINIDEQTSQ